MQKEGHMKNREIAKLFNQIADLLELKGDNPFRIRAYRRAAQNIEALSKDLAEIPEEALRKIPGIGKDLAGKITEYLRDGKIGALEELKGDIPEGLLEVITIPGVGPKTAKLLNERLGITGVAELEDAAREGRLLDLPGIRERTVQNILKGIALLRKGRERRPIGKVMPLAEEIVERLSRLKGVRKISLAGSLRRWKETIKDIDILITSTDPEGVMEKFVNLPSVSEVLQRGSTKSSVIIDEGLQVDLRVVEENSFGAALQYFTGSKAHNIRLREMAVRKGLKINEYGIFNEETGQRIGGEREEDIYNALGLPWIPPELREDLGEIEAAIKGGLPELIDLADIRGDLHIHSRWSDGSHEVPELIEEARRKGYEYIAITDHTKGLGIAGGLTEERLLEQKKEIDSINKGLRGFHVFMGVEVDIRGDGRLDLPEEVLERLDFVVASIHSGFRQEKEKLTKRVISAIKCPVVDLIAHPTGRLIGEREPYDIDMEAVLDAAENYGKALEINAFPLRLDLNDRYAREAKKRGIPVVISTDSHILEQFRFMRYGISVARRGWLEKSDVLNALPLREFSAYLKKRRAAGKRRV
jgi:DNA polymerase (family 10)